MQPAGVMDPEIAGQMAAIGIVKGKNFNPDARIKRSLTEAPAVANGAGRSMSIGVRTSEGFGYYGGDSQWINGFGSGDTTLLLRRQNLRKTESSYIRATAHGN